MMFLFAGHSAGLLSKNFVKQRLHEILESQRNARRTGISYLSVRFFFFMNTYKDLREDAYICPSQPKKAPQNLLLHGKLNSGYRIHL